jgi:hypothetical protein
MKVVMKHNTGNENSFGIAEQKYRQKEVIASGYRTERHNKFLKDSRKEEK